MMRDDQRARAILANQRGVAARAQVLSWGLTAEGVRYRIRSGGPWQRLLPGVYLTVTGQPTGEQLQIAAMLHAGPDGVITGPTALRNYGIRAPETGEVDVLVPAGRKRRSCGYVVIRRTRRMPASVTVDGPLGFAPPQRAVADTVRGLGELSDARAVVASAVQQGRCTVQQLQAELREGPIRGSAQLRSVLAEVVDGIRSVPEAEFRDLIRKSGLPLPLYNPRIYLGTKLLAVPDAWWPDAGVVAEVDSAEWHLSPADWEHTMRRDRRLAAVGIVVLHFSPRQLRTEPKRLLHDIAAALRAGRPIPGITTRRSAA
jgi:hypothetical protein